ncbi:MAG: protein adenylyltransferase SelO [Solirubrobacteraceae bacterium]
MPVAARSLFAFDNSYVRELPELNTEWRTRPVPEPRLLAFNAELAEELGLDADALRTAEGLEILAGAAAPEGAAIVAQAYAGHQFGMFQPRLGDGRALLLGEVLGRDGRRHDLHLKGSGRTPFARGGDGNAAVGPMLREYVIGEAMHALGIPTTRALAVVATGEDVRRETMLPGAVLTRVAASHLRVGTFQYAATQLGPEVVRRLADYAIARHHPEIAGAERPYLAFFEAVVEAQASLVCRWMLAGFIHGVMNTDNMTISGETIDYGPCAFMEAYDPATVYSSIDHAGRYAYGQQPGIAQWNLARLAEAILPLVHADQDTAVQDVTAVLHTYPQRFEGHWLRGMRAKLGLPAEGAAHDDMLGEILALLHAHRVDYTSFFRALAAEHRGDTAAAGVLFAGAPEFSDWLERWRPLADPGAMDRVNPLYIPRNHLVEEALAAATAGDLAPFERLLEAVSAPFDARPGLERYAEPAPETFGRYQTFCGT